jgi:hypothetical protein
MFCAIERLSCKRVVISIDLVKLNDQQFYPVDTVIKSINEGD